MNAGTETMGIFYEDELAGSNYPCGEPPHYFCGACRACYGHLNALNGRRYQIDTACCSPSGCASKEVISQAYIINGLEANTLQCHDADLSIPTTSLTEPKNSLTKFPDGNVKGIQIRGTYYGCNPQGTIATETVCNSYPQCSWHSPNICLPKSTTTCPVNFMNGPWLISDASDGNCEASGAQASQCDASGTEEQRWANRNILCPSSSTCCEYAINPTTRACPVGGGLCEPCVPTAGGLCEQGQYHGPGIAGTCMGSA